MIGSAGRWRQLIAARRARGLSLSGLGPNEARILFDFATVLAAGLVTWLLARLVALQSPGLPPPVVLSLQVATFLGANLLFGLYGRHRAGPVGFRLRRLVSSVGAACMIGLLAGGELFVPLAWGALVLPPVVLTRWMASLVRSGAQPIRRLVTDPHAPIAVLGGAGYIGTHTVAELLSRGYAVRVLDRLMYGTEPLRDFLGHPRFQLIEGDVTDIARLTEAVNGCRAVVHLAGLVGDPACAVDPDYTAHTNIVATRMAHEVAHSLGVTRFIFASSCSVYGMAETEVDELSPLNPVSLYARTKIDSERELLWNTPDNFFVTVLRFATVFGHSRRPRFDLVANLFTAQAMIEGRIRVIGPQQWRPFVHVRDLARSVAVCLEAPEALVQSQVFNIGDARLNRTILALAEAVQGVVSSHREVTVAIEEQPDADRRNYFVSFDKVRRLLGFEAQVSIEDGVREMAEHFAADRYGDYRTALYSNLATTRRAVDDFHDPAEQARLYGPLERTTRSAS
jgi:nucleoside-diphosphate-sugar epimerase